MEENNETYNEQPEKTESEKPITIDSFFEELKNYKIKIEAPLDDSSDPEKAFIYLTRNMKTDLDYLQLAKEEHNVLKIKQYRICVYEIMSPLLLKWQKKAETYYRNILQVSDSSQTLNVGQVENHPISDTKILTAVPRSTPQITCDASKEEIMQYFMILSKEENFNNGNPYMRENDVIDFVESNFSVFGKTPVKKYYPVNITNKSTLTFFIYEFYKRFDYANTNNKIKYAELLISNFETFANENPKILRSNMGPSKRPKNNHIVIPVEKYYSKVK